MKKREEQRDKYISLTFIQKLRIAQPVLYPRTEGRSLSHPTYQPLFDLCFSFVCRADAIEVAAEDALCGKGYELTLFLFTDIMVVAKRKSTKGMSMMRSPSTASLASGQQHLLQNKVGTLYG